LLSVSATLMCVQFDNWDVCGFLLVFLFMKEPLIVLQLYRIRRLVFWFITFIR